jgi:hypothetical protein
MRRRRLLASLVVAELAGCGSRSDVRESSTDSSQPESTNGSTDDTTTTERRATRTPTPTPVIGTLPKPDCPDDPVVPYTSAENASSVPDPPSEFTQRLK